MIRMYANYTCEISVLSGDHLSFRQPSPAVSGVRQNVAHAAQENGQKAETLIISFVADVCRLQPDYCLGGSQTDQRLNRLRTIAQHIAPITEAP